MLGLINYKYVLLANINKRTNAMMMFTLQKEKYMCFNMGLMILWRTQIKNVIAMSDQHKMSITRCKEITELLHKLHMSNVIHVERHIEGIFHHINRKLPSPK